MKKSILTLLILVSLTYSIYGTTLSGSVLDSAGATVASATVQVTGHESASTNESGGYVITIAAGDGNYTAYAVKSGYYRHVIHDIDVSDDTAQNFTMGSPDYVVGDMDDIVIDVAGTGMVSVKGQVPTLVDLGVLYLIMALFLAVMGIAIAVFIIVPKKMKISRAR